MSHKVIPPNSKISSNLTRLVPPIGSIQRVAVLDKDTELEILGIKFKNGFTVEVPYDILHTHSVRFQRIVDAFYGPLYGIRTTDSYYG